ncbi:hypothetical protein Nepgr_004227 [Nepenthes gracilis]|uniref:Uncharacterized protein n=1 Tax=Nepenthes gracilis TaxID=150966 RepID=A0AAD3S128_NEPGR|nr:hypothetical protein Nepgr_004227 [Nepenthes gracilis]
MSKTLEPPPNTDDDYSPSSTLIPFDRPLSLLRGPVLAGPTDNPSIGPYILAFRDPQSFLSAYKFCERKILEQCEAGVRIGCSISASNKCRPPWWKALFGGNKIDFRERERCEEREMAICIEASKDKCVKFAKEKCKGPFMSARIAVRERKLREKEVGKLISCVSCLGVLKGNVGSEIILLNQFGSLLSSNFVHQVTNYRGSKLLDDDNL